MFVHPRNLRIPVRMVSAGVQLSDPTQRAVRCFRTPGCRPPVPETPADLSDLPEAAPCYWVISSRMSATRACGVSTTPSGSNKAKCSTSATFIKDIGSATLAPGPFGARNVTDTQALFLLTDYAVGDQFNVIITVTTNYNQTRTDRGFHVRSKPTEVQSMWRAIRLCICRLLDLPVGRV